MVKALGEQVASLFPQEKGLFTEDKAAAVQVDYKHKYELLVAFIDGVATMAIQADNMSAEQATDAILNYISVLDLK